MDDAAPTLLPLLIALPFVVAACTPLLGRTRLPPWLPALGVAAACCAGFAFLAARGDEAPFSLPWIPALGIAFALRLDGLAALMAVLVAGIGVLIVAYSAAYLPHDAVEHGEPRRPATFYGYLLFFLGSMLGLVCADDLVALYAFWEATSVSSFLLIGLWLNEESSRDSAIQAFVITAGAGLLLFVALLLIAADLGTTSIPEVARRADELAGSPFVPGIVLGIVLGAGAKSAQAPLHIWLPNAMVAPTPVSAFLHSATMVAAGVFLLARLAPVLAAVPGLGEALVAMGAITMVAAGIVAMGRHGLKEILAWSTISQYGYVTVLLGLQAWGPALFLIANHAIVKAGLFLCAGIVTHATGRSDVHELGGLWRTHPITTAIAGVLALGLAGLPLTSGFWMKELLYREVAAENLPSLEFFGLAAGVFTFVYMVRFFWRTFLVGPWPQGATRERELLPLVVPAGLLALPVIAVGLAPSLSSRFTDAAASAAARMPVETGFALHWPPDRALELTAITYLLGGALFAWLDARERGRAAQPSGPFPHPRRPALAPGFLAAAVIRQLGPRRLWEWSLPALDAAGRWAARLQTGRLLHYLLFLVAVPVGLSLALLPQVIDWPRAPAPTEIDQPSLAFAMLAISAIGLAFGSALVHSHVAAILMVGGVGFVLALIFSLLRAPDVALVQVAVETVTALLLLIALSRIRVTVREQAMSPRGQRSPAARTATVLIAAAAGGLVTATLLALQANLGAPELGQSYFPLTADLAFDDVVTAILVDFRGLDTMGEITVFAAAMLGAVLLLGVGRETGGRRATTNPEGRRPSVVVRMTTRLTFPVVLVFAAEHMVNASSAPGEGFSGGLLTAMSILLLYVGVGYERVERELRVFGKWGLAAGIALALLAGFLGLATERRAFLASGGAHPEVLGAPIDLTTHALFDVAIFFVVASGALGIFRALGGKERST